MVKILIAGDYASRARVAKLIDAGRYDEIFEEVRVCTSTVDYSIVNLEAPVVETESAIPIEKYGPNLKCSAKALDAIRYAGFDMVTLANNHFYDYGEDGVNDTLQTCENIGLDIVGGGKNIQQASEIVYKEINTIKFAFINCCENEFSIATDNKGGSNPINPVQQFYALQQAKQYADFVIVIVHGGPEGYQYPTPRMKELYRFYVDAGADVVINHHQHCYSGYEEYKGRLIFYGLGNFCFDSANENKSTWNQGYMVQLTFDKELIACNLIPYIQGHSSPGVVLLTDEEEEAFKDFLLGCNEVIRDDSKLNLKYRQFCEASAEMYLTTLEPYTNKYLRYARSRRLLPSFLSKERALGVMNYIMCESHNERFQYVLRDKYK